MTFLQVQEVMKELRIYIVGFDRAGYGQSTPNPKRTMKSDVYDVQVEFLDPG